MTAAAPRRLCVYLDPRGFGGMERSLATLLDGLDARYAVELISTDQDIASEIAQARAGTRVTVVPRVMGKLDLASIRAHVRAFRTSAPDLVVTCHGQLYAAQYGIMASVLTRCPVVAVIHCILPSTDRVQAMLLRNASRFVARFIGVSESVARATESELHLAPGAVTVIYNGVPEPAPATTELRARERGRRILGCVGRLSPEKGYDVALHALAELPDCELVILGEGPQLGKLRRIASSLGVSDRVSFEGWVPPPWTARWPIDALLVPSRYEGFGLVAVEAMLAGIPVVASNVAGLSEVLMDGKTGLLVEPDQPDDLARATRRVLDDRDLREEVVGNAREDARGRFSPGTMVASYEALFDEVLEPR